MQLKGYSFPEGEIILVDESIFANLENPQEGDIQRLVKNFECFLIVAGNLNWAHRKLKDDGSNREENKQEFLDRLNIWGAEAGGRR